MNKDFLDDIIKQKLDQQEYEFTPTDWKSFESKQNGSGGSGSSLKWYLGGAAAITIIAVTTYFITSNAKNDSLNIPSKVEQIDKPSIAQNKSITSTQEENSKVEIPFETNIESVDKNENNSQKPTTHNLDDGSNPADNNSILITENSSDQSNEGSTSSDAFEVSENNSNETQYGNAANQSTLEIAIPSSLIMAEKMEVCPGEKISFETIEQENVTYSWNFGDDNYSNQRNVEHSYKKSGKYFVTLIVTSSLDRSILSKSKDMAIEVLPLPNTEFTVNELENEIIPSIQLISNEELSNYNWDFGDGTHSSDRSPIKSYKQKGYYNVTLTSKNPEGCTSKTTHKVTIKEDYNLLAPNSFTPNGDGINDYFIPEALKLMDVDFTMSIYSKSEGLIFESKNINQQWDGRNQQNGQNCGEDTYIWVVSLITKEGKSEHYKGAVLLLK